MTTVEPRWRRLEPEERRREIFSCAQRLFTALPFDQVSTSDIATEAGVTRGLVNHYFGTKRDLYLEVVREAAEFPQTPIAYAGDASIEERIDNGVQWYLDAALSASGSWINVHGERGLGRDPELEAILGAAEDATIDRVLEAIGLEHEQSHRTERRAIIRTYGQLARTAVREWTVKDRLSREQVHQLLGATLLTIVRDVLPSLDEATDPH